MVDIATALHERGERTLIVGMLEAEPMGGPVPSIGLSARQVSSAALPLHRLISTRQPATVISTLKHVSIVVTFVKHMSTTPFRHIVRVANTYSRELSAFSAPKRAIWSALLRHVHHAAESTICVSEGVRRDLVANYGLRREQVIPNPVDVDRLLRAAPTDGGGDHERPFTVLSVGRLSPQKNYACLIRAFRQVVAVDASARLVILGEGSERPRLEAEIDALGLQHNVSLEGWVANPYPYYRAADVFALSSDFEGMPNVLIEALAFNLPVVSTDCESGPREILVSEALGYLVPVGDHDAIAAKLLTFLGGRPAGNFRAQYIARHHDIDEIASRYQKIVFPR
jgi:glycosyltransferase involved in cell wall biosynthesis